MDRPRRGQIRTWIGRLLRRATARGNDERTGADSQPMWCLVGNIVAEHRFGMADEVRRGSKQFSSGTKVYCLPPQWGDMYEKCVAVGIARGSRRWITVVMSRDLVENPRAKVVYDPLVVKRLRDGFQGFDRQWESREEIEYYVQSWPSRTLIAARRPSGRGPSGRIGPADGRGPGDPQPHAAGTEADDRA